MPVSEQLARRGFAVVNHHSDLLDDIPSREGTQNYLDETADPREYRVLRKAIGASQVITWNSTVRRNEPETVKTKDVPSQQEPEKGFVPTSRLQPVAGVAHVDQDDVWGKQLVTMAAGRSADTFKRSQIINVWRPLNGPVTNAPLAMLDYRSLGPGDMAKHGHMFGVGFDIHHSAGQSWSYIRHQQSDEIIFLKCFDSMQGADGSALYAGHVAVKVDGEEEGIASELIRPRESIEVRLVAVWE
ncbi:MAG: hypothetical protein TREMPRED_001422 [Tremellales sp. Tagirdzhanova-0007]|nr:MAG: hypothetical protein TREMPRED_001422 [Tremellales sp. Tagirdzhanova-0007]